MTQRHRHVKAIPHLSELPAKGSTTTAQTASLSVLKHISATACKEYGKAESTRKAYAHYVQKGKAFLAESVAEQLWDADGGVDGIELELWKKAFDGPPNRNSAHALELFLAKKCLHEGCSQSTAEVIQAAFADFWDNM